MEQNSKVQFSKVKSMIRSADCGLKIAKDSVDPSKAIDARLLFVLEGGDNVVSLSESVRASLRALSNTPDSPPSFRHAPRAIHAIENEWPPELILKFAPASIGV